MPTLLDCGLPFLLLTIFAFAKGPLLCTTNYALHVECASQFVQKIFADQIPAGGGLICQSDKFVMFLNIRV